MACVGERGDGSLLRDHVGVEGIAGAVEALGDVGRREAEADAESGEGVITRPLGPYNMPKHLRISIGTAEEMERCAAALARVWKPA